jgi:hypothetical protein
VASIHLAVLLVSFGILGYEIALMRYFSVVTWHHLAYMIISLALLGFGASGTYLSLLRTSSNRLLRSFFLPDVSGFQSSVYSPR